MSDSRVECRSSGRRKGFGEHLGAWVASRMYVCCTVKQPSNELCNIRIEWAGTQASTALDVLMLRITVFYLYIFARVGVDDYHHPR